VDIEWCQHAFDLFADLAVAYQQNALTC
jgi:hypothetical protein